MRKMFTSRAQKCALPDFADSPKTKLIYTHKIRVAHIARQTVIRQALVNRHTTITLNSVQELKRKAAFSLVEMLMALLVASLLLAALAPVATRKMNENLHITGNFTPNSRSEIKEISYGDPEFCSNIVRDANGNELYCEGEYVVPAGFRNITVVAVGGGGGGGAAPASGYIEYGNEGGTNAFIVPPMVDKLEATLISGGGGGGAGGQVESSVPYNTSGEFTWNVPAIAKNKYAVITGCGGGGGGGGFVTAQFISGAAGGLGGGGGYFSKAVLASNDNYSVIIGGGGGGGAGGSNSAHVSTYVGTGEYHRGYNGAGGAGGGGGADAWNDTGATGGLGGKNGGTGGYARAVGTLLGFGGERGDTSLSSNSDGNNGVKGLDSQGGIGASYGGKALWLNFKKPDGTDIPHGQGGGGGGGSTTGYGGGGGGGGCGGSGGGGGGGATIFGTRSNPIFLAAGGGGGGGGGIDDFDYTIGSELPESYNYATGDFGRQHGGGGGGGGGGGTGGGNGGNGGRAMVAHGQNGSNAAGYLSSTVFGTNYCNGGSAFQSPGTNWLRRSEKGGSGKSGAMRITYLDYGPGGSGGGSGQIVPLQKVSVTSGEKLDIQIGKGGSGGVAGKITASSTISDIAVAATDGSGGNNSEWQQLRTSILRNSTRVLTTSFYQGYSGSYGGAPTGRVYAWTAYPYNSAHGGITIGSPNTEVLVEKAGFATTDGHNAGDYDGTKSIAIGAVSFANKTSGGAGGKIITPWFTCTAGKGGRAPGEQGTDASGYGCGGGGGFGLSNGGKGSGGYARLSWNMYWDTALNAYVSDITASGAGGAAGNVIKETVRVNDGQVIRIRIGAGGIGGKVLNNALTDATSGGETIFGSDEFIKIRAGGGGGGGNPFVQGGQLVKGTAGKPSTICHVGSRDLHTNSRYCTRGTAGGVSPDSAGSSVTGGAGAAFNFKLAEKTYQGRGGQGGIKSSEYNNSKGQGAEGIASGGGGAALLINNQITNTTQLNYPQGGNGASGKIILQLWE